MEVWRSCHWKDKREVRRVESISVSKRPQTRLNWTEKTYVATWRPLKLRIGWEMVLRCSWVYVTLCLSAAALEPRRQWQPPQWVQNCFLQPRSTCISAFCRLDQAVGWDCCAEQGKIPWRGVWRTFKIKAEKRMGETRPAPAAKSSQSCPSMCHPIDSSPHAPLSLGFSRQEYWSGLPLPSLETRPEQISNNTSATPTNSWGGFFFFWELRKRKEDNLRSCGSNLDMETEPTHICK